MSGKAEVAEPERGYWQKLHARTVSERNEKKVSADNIQSSLIVRLKELASKNHCPKQAIGWFTIKGDSGGLRLLRLKEGLPKKDKRGHSAIELTDLQYVEDGALLTLSVLVDPRAQRLLEYSIGIQGQSKNPGRFWYARIDLDQEPKGVGLCGHPLLHCHVGEPSEVFTPRVPLPWMMPVDALDWLLSTVHSPLDRTHAAQAP